MLVSRGFILPGVVCLLLSSLLSAQQKSKVQLQVNETIFSVATALNACGYDDGLNESEPVRLQVRSEVGRAVQQSADARAAKNEMCQFYREHQPSDVNRDLSQYVSLALNLGYPPDFKPTMKEADLPPDTNYVLGFVPLVAHFYKAAHLHQVWTDISPQYNTLIEKFNEPLANLILQTDLYLKNPISGYMGRQFVIYLEPMTGPGKINARNYGDDYFLIASPEKNELPMEEIRHTYLHFMLDQLAMRRASTMKRLAPLLKEVQSAPLEQNFKTDISLLITECLIRAIEARTIPGGKAAEPRREQEVQRDMADGYILTKYFYESLEKFEKEPTSLKDAFGDFLYYLDVGREAKQASNIQFNTNGRAEVVEGKSADAQNQLETAQQKLADGDLAGAQSLAQQVMAKNSADAPRACFILGEIATLNKDKDSAIKYFQQSLQTAKDPGLIAWSHIYLGRIYDVDQERDLAVKHYQAALRAGDSSPQTKAAAERGLKSPYERRASSQEEQ